MNHGSNGEGTHCAVVLILDDCYILGDSITISDIIDIIAIDKLIAISNISV